MNEFLPSQLQPQLELFDVPWIPQAALQNINSLQISPVLALAC